MQLLPGATDEEITQLENNLAAAPSVTEMLRQGMTPEDMMERVMKGFGPQILDTHRSGIPLQLQPGTHGTCTDQPGLG